MNRAGEYARALFELVERDPSNTSAYVANLTKALKERGYEKLLSKIASEFEKIALRKERSARYRAVTPERERTRVLLELYRRLVATE